MVEAAPAADQPPPDLALRTPFGDDVIRARLPDPGGFGCGTALVPGMTVITLTTDIEAPIERRLRPRYRSEWSPAGRTAPRPGVALAVTAFVYSFVARDEGDLAAQSSVDLAAEPFCPERRITWGSLVGASRGRLLHHDRGRALRP